MSLERVLLEFGKKCCRKIGVCEKLENIIRQ